MEAIIGKKVGMTQVFKEDGEMVPVTVIEAGPTVVTQIKTLENDGYNAVQVGYGNVRETLLNKPLVGHLKKAGVGHKRYLREFRVDDTAQYELSQEFKVDIFQAGDMVDATGISKGKGTQGPVKRHGFSRGPESHGSKYHRATGGLAGSSTPGRVLKGRKMAGKMGHDRVTIKNLEVVQVDPEKNIILVKGSVPGPKKSLIILKKAVH